VSPVKLLTDHHKGPCLVTKPRPDGGRWVIGYLSQADRRAGVASLVLVAGRGAIRFEAVGDVSTGEEHALLLDCLEHAAEILRAETGGTW
jgi:hypothetical protein